jgi:hypothetical protein
MKADLQAPWHLGEMANRFGYTVSALKEDLVKKA